VTGKDLEERSDAELGRQLQELKAELFNLRFQHAAGQLENPIRLRDVRHDIARVMTAQRMRELDRSGSGAAR
jgi:large subunit ribosomal protein L29